MNNRTRFIYIIFLCVFALLLSSCSKREGAGDSSEERGEYMAIKALDSYEQLLRAREIVRKNYNPKAEYSVDSMGDGFTVWYLFSQPHEWTRYPIGFEEFFTDKTDGNFSTIICLDGQECYYKEEHAEHINTVFLYPEDPDYERFTACLPCALVWVGTRTAQPVEDPTLLSVSRNETDDDIRGYCVYNIYYGDTLIIRLHSCALLDDEFFDTFYEHLVIVE